MPEVLPEAPTRLPCTPLVRPSRPSDVADIRAIYAEHVENGLASFEEIAPDENTIAERRDAALQLGLPHLVVELDGRVAGFAYARPYHTRSGYRHTLEDSVYVANHAIRRGLGLALLERLIDDCAALGYRQMVAMIGDSANARSIGLHARAGFRTVGTLNSIGFKFGRWVDSVLMQRTLGDGDTTLPGRTRQTT